ncbi:MAG: glycosyltransferase family 2 protein [Chitinophagaceae bacterium]|jgi:glycosyltransferase involved in cell wall biosynthesis|nr:glycosyltransferase family 2 protein [Chitinophagaceae bacterium]
MEQFPLKLTVVIITFNEERNVEDCLKSVKDVADEILVVDSFSTDRTEKICEAYGARFVQNKWEGIVAQRNFAQSLASHPVLLNIDADERLSAELAASIMQEKKRGFPMKGYTMNRFNNYCGQWIRHGNYYPDRKLRLYHKNAGRVEGANPHEWVQLNENYPVQKLHGDLLHYSFRTFSEHVAKMNLFSSVAAQTLFTRGRKPSYIKPILSAFWAFFYALIIRRGFLDGYYGYVIARNNAMYSFYKYAKLNELHKGKDI